MSANTIRLNNDFSLTVNGVTLPGFVERVSIGGQMVLGEAELLLTSGSEKTFNGFDDASVKLYLTMIEPTDGGTSRYDKLLILTSAFKKLRQGEPVVYALEGNVFRSHQLKAALFRGLSSDDGKDADRLDVVISLVEHDPVVGKVQKQQGAAAQDGGTTDIQPTLMTAAENRKLQALEADYHE